MTTIGGLVEAAGGLLHKRDLVAHGATDRHLTSAVRRGEVRRPRRGWYSTWSLGDPRFVATAVGGRVAGAAALALQGAWSWSEPALVVSVPRTASRLRRRRGVRVVWDAPGVVARGSSAVVDPRDALSRAVVEAARFEDAVVLADWARHAGVVDRLDAELVLGAHRRDAAGLAAWSDGGAQSILESVAGTRLRLRGRRVERQVVVGELGEAVDMVVDGLAALETDGRRFHEASFERDRRKDALSARAGYLPLRASFSAVRDRWTETEASIDALIRTAGGPPPRRRPAHELPRPLSPRGARAWRLARRPARPPARRADRTGGGDRGREDASGMPRRRTGLAPDVTDSTPASTVPAPSAPVVVDVWSDIACPWCFIGKRKFEAAVERFDGEVAVVYHSFELSPETPVDFEGDEVDFLSRHKGMPADQVQGMLENVAGIAREVGLAYDFDALRHTNTVKAHQLLHFAKARGRQLDMKERLLSAYFEEGRHVGRVQDLADLASEIGLDRDEVVTALDGDVHLDDVRADQQQAQAYGISGVPFFVLEGKYGISGAQAPETFLGALQQVVAERDAEAAPVVGPTR